MSDKLMVCVLNYTMATFAVRGNFFAWSFYNPGSTTNLKHLITLFTACTGTMHEKCTSLSHFTSTLVVTSHEINAFSMSMSFVFSWSHKCRPTRTQAVHSKTCLWHKNRRTVAFMWHHYQSCSENEVYAQVVHKLHVLSHQWNMVCFEYHKAAFKVHCSCVAVSCSGCFSVSAPTTAVQYCNKVNMRCSALCWAVVDKQSINR